MANPISFAVNCKDETEKEEIRTTVKELTLITNLKSYDVVLNALKFYSKELKKREVK